MAPVIYQETKATSDILSEKVVAYSTDIVDAIRDHLKHKQWP